MSDGLTVEERATNAETWAHIAQVQRFLMQMIERLQERAMFHDQSKLVPPEVSAFAEATPRLAKLTYGSPEYKASLDSIRPAIDHHNAWNSHHPEHYEDGVDGMDLLDLVEMLADWKAAGLRHEDGDIMSSIEHNRGRFGLSDQLVSVLRNTVERLGWTDRVCVGARVNVQTNEGVGGPAIIVDENPDNPKARFKVRLFSGAVTTPFWALNQEIDELWLKREKANE